MLNDSILLSDQKIARGKELEFPEFFVNTVVLEQELEIDD
jgi:hypothetical protein